MRNRTKTFSARLSEQEYETLNKEIAKTGLTKSAFIRTVARGYLPKPRPPNGYNEMMSELTDIATNIYSISNGTFNIHKIDTEFLQIVNFLEKFLRNTFWFGGDVTLRF